MKSWKEGEGSEGKEEVGGVKSLSCYWLRYCRFFGARRIAHLIGFLSDFFGAITRRP